jgi:ubiquinone/menaquinone biosynthesis C-methylase UbiE
MYSGLQKKFIEPAAVASHFHLRKGDCVADFGAGSGFFMKPLSEAVGNEGKVYLCEIQKNLVEALGTQAHTVRLTNVHPVWGDLEVLGGTKLPDALLDAGLLSNTLFQLGDKETALKEIARVMHKGSRLFIIDWADSFGGLGPRFGDIVSEDDAKVLAEHAGFIFERTFPAGDHHYGLAFRKV